MFYVPLYIEAVRSRPVLVFWLATLAQAALWILVPTVFYAAPPGVLPQVLAIGHEFPLRGDTGPPLAYWLAIRQGMHSNGVYWSIVIAEGSIAVASIILFKRGRWKQRMI